MLFFALVIDALSRMIVGWQLAAHMRTTLVLDARKMAPGSAARAPTWSWCTTSIAAPTQYVSFAYTQTLSDHRVLQSVGPVGDAYDKELVSHCTSLG